MVASLVIFARLFWTPDRVLFFSWIFLHFDAMVKFILWKGFRIDTCKTFTKGQK